MEHLLLCHWHPLQLGENVIMRVAAIFLNKERGKHFGKCGLSTQLARWKLVLILRALAVQHCLIGKKQLWMRAMEDHAKLDPPPTFLICIFVTSCVNTKPFGERSFSYSGLFVWNSFTHVPTLILLPLSKLPSKPGCSVCIPHHPPTPHPHNFCFLCGKFGSWRKINS